MVAGRKQGNRFSQIVLKRFKGPSQKFSANPRFNARIKEYDASQALQCQVTWANPIVLRGPCGTRE